MALAGKLDLNFALTAPVHPWGRVTLPQMARTLDFFFDNPGAGRFLLAYIERWNKSKSVRVQNQILDLEAEVSYLEYVYAFFADIE